MVVYDITSDKSFENISKWLRYIEEYANEDVEKMILGSKCDIEDYRVVSRERGNSVSLLMHFKGDLAVRFCTLRLSPWCM